VRFRSAPFANSAFIVWTAGKSKNLKKKYDKAEITGTDVEDPHSKKFRTG
jgi:hypothetical protein